MRKILMLTAGLLAGTVSSSLYADTLADALEAAWEADPEWSAALRTWEAGQENKKLGRAALLPNVSARYSWMDNDFKLRRTGNSLDYETETVAVTLAQPLFRPEAWYAYKQGDAATSVAEAEFAQARQLFFQRVASTYFEVLRTWENLASAQAEERAIKEQLDQTDERYEVGLVAQTEVHEAEAAYDLAKVNVIMMQAEFDIARDKLEALTGRSWQQMATLLEDLPLNTPEPAEPNKWMELAQAQNPSLLAAQQQTEVLRYNARQQTSAMLPTVDLVAQHQRYRDNANIPPTPGNPLSDSNLQPKSRTNVYGIEVNMPLFQGGGLNSKRKQTALQHEASVESYQQAWRDVGQQTLASFRLVTANASHIKARKQAIRSAESALEATQAGYDVGTRNIIEVLNAQRTLFAAQRDYANARYDYILSSLNLKALAGVLSEEDIVQVNSWLSTIDQVDLEDVENGHTEDN